MSSEIIASLIASIIGGLLVAVVNFFFTKDKIKAETKMIEAQTSLLTAKLERLNTSVDAAIETVTSHEKTVYDLTVSPSVTDFDAKGVAWENKPSEMGKGSLLLKQGMLYVERENLVGTFSVYLDKYYYRNDEKNLMPHNLALSGTRKIKISCKVKTNKGKGSLLFRLLEVQQNGKYVVPGSIESRTIGVIENIEWVVVEILFKATPASNYKIGFHYYDVSEPNALLMQNLLITERICKLKNRVQQSVMLTFGFLWHFILPKRISSHPQVTTQINVSL